MDLRAFLPRPAPPYPVEFSLAPPHPTPRRLLLLPLPAPPRGPKAPPVHPWSLLFPKREFFFIKADMGSWSRHFEVFSS